MGIGKSIVAGVVLVAVIFALTIIGGSFYTIDQGERGVILRYGAISTVANPGLSFKLPMIDTLVRVNVQNDVAHYDELAAYSKDQQPTTLKISVSYHIPAAQVTQAYTEYGGKENVVSKVLDRKVFEQVKNVFGTYTAVRAIQERAHLNSEVEKAVRDSISNIGKDVPLVVDSVQIENIDFSDAYEASIEQRMLAEVDVQKSRQNAEKEKVQASIAVTQAQGRADSVKAEAIAKADATRLAGEAEADAIRAKGAALKDNPSLIALTAAEKWDGKLPSSMIPGSAVPFIELKQ